MNIKTAQKLVVVVGTLIFTATLLITRGLLVAIICGSFFFLTMANTLKKGSANGG